MQIRSLRAGEFAHRDSKWVLYPLFRRVAADHMGIEGAGPGVGWKIASVIAMLALFMLVGLACGTKASPESTGPSQSDLLTPSASPDFSSEITSLLTLASLYQDTGEYEQASPTTMNRASIAITVVGLACGTKESPDSTGGPSIRSSNAIGEP